MNRAIQTLLNLAWGLWFGGLVTLFLAVQSLFKTFADDHPVAGLAASGVFGQFNRFRLFIAAAAVLLTFLSWLRGRSGLKMAVFACLGLAICIGVYTTAVLTPKIDNLRRQGQTQTTSFRRLHGISMSLYLVETTFVLGAGLMLPSSSKT